MYTNQQVIALANRSFAGFQTEHLRMMGTPGRESTYRHIQDRYAGLTAAVTGVDGIGPPRFPSSEPRNLNVDKKKRHLTEEERKYLHKPQSDWQESARGDVCRSACTVEVGDIITKYSK